MTGAACAAALRGVTLTLGGRAILTDVTLDLPQGAFIGVLGPNGAGKTTLLRALLGLIAPAAGTIRVLGQSPREARAAIGYLPQTRTPLSTLNIAGRDFVATAAGHEAWPILPPSRADRADVIRAMTLAGAAAYANRPVKTLSGGERQRLLLAQALLGSPRLLLLDEPLTSLDPHYQAATIDLVRQLQQDFGLTVLFTAHELNPLLPALDRVLYLGQGHAAIGTVPEIMTPAILSRLYGTPIDVFEVGGRLFVMADGHAVERDTHAHL